VLHKLLYDMKSSADSRKINSNVIDVDKPFSATAQDRKSMSFLRSRIGDSSNNSNQ
jgi:hypothetical protein